MPRSRRQAPGGIAYHVMNRASGRLDLFQDAGDYEAFERVLQQAIAREPAVRVCGYCLMPNPFHLVLWPSADDRLFRRAKTAPSFTRVRSPRLRGRRQG